MKKFICLILAVLLAASCTACGSFGKVDLQAPIAMEEDGIVKENVIAQMQKENAIGTFTGRSNDLDYEWTVFGSDISEPADVNFLVDLEKEEDALALSLSAQAPFGFPALLSVHLDEVWQAQTATAYNGDTPIASVSLTGTKQTVLNLSLDGSVRNVTIKPDQLPEDAAEAEVITQTTASAPVSTVAPAGNTTSAQTVSPSVSTTVTMDASYTSSSGNTSGNASGNTSGSSSNRVYSDGSQTGKDAYLTDPIPVGKPMPVEPENQVVNSSKSLRCTFSIECSTILNNLDQLDPDKLEMVPSGGTILATTTVTFSEGESVFDVLQRLCREKGIHMESSWTPIYNSAYIEGLHNLYEFDCGSLSGWMYRVNGWYPNYGCSRYRLQDGDRVEWRYTCDLGHDIGGAYAVTGQSE